MTKKQQIIANAESFVRDVVSKDFGQTIDDAKVRTIARQVSKAIPVQTSKRSVNRRTNVMIAAE